MSLLRKIVLIVLVSTAFSSLASAQEHWLVGTWKGALTNLPSTNRFGADRTLEIKSVSPDGKAQGSWVGGAGTVRVALVVSGNEVTFTTPGSSGASYKLVHNAGTMNGSWTPTGGASSGGSVTLKKQ